MDTILNILNTANLWLYTILGILIFFVITYYMFLCGRAYSKDKNKIWRGELATEEICDTITGMAKHEAESYIFDCQKKVLWIKRKNICCNVIWKCKRLHTEYSQIIIPTKVLTNKAYSIKSIILALLIAYKQKECECQINRSHAQKLAEQYGFAPKAWENNISNLGKEDFGLSSKSAIISTYTGAIEFLRNKGKDKYSQTITFLEQQKSSKESEM